MTNKKAGGTVCGVARGGLWQAGDTGEEQHRRPDFSSSLVADEFLIR